MLKKVFFIFFIIIFLSGCSSKKDFDEITFSTWGSITEINIIKNIISNYERENPDTKINLLHIPQNYFQKIHLLFASNTAPDIVFINNLYLPLYSPYLEDLTLYIDKNEFYPVAIDSLSYNQKILAIPRDVSNLVLYINNELIEKELGKWTLEKLLEVAKNNTNKDTYGIGFESEIYWALPFLNYFSGGILDNTLNNIFYTKESQAGIGFYLDLIKKYKVAPTKSQIGSSTLAQMFLDKKIAIYISGRWMYPKICEDAKFEWSVKEFPTNSNPHLADASGWAISKNSKHKEKALDFVNYLSSSNNAKYLAETGLIVPANIEASLILNNEEHQQYVFLEVMKNSSKTPISKNYKKITDEINSEIFN